jgi:glycosyltransferase involved in cell wall biosynthesis
MPPGGPTSGQYFGALRRPVPRVLRALEPAGATARALAARQHGWRSVAATCDAVAWMRFERAVVARADTIVALTDGDREVFQSLGTSTPIARIGLTPRVPDRPANPDRADDRTIAFVANFAHEPNIHAARTLALHVLPSVRTEIDDARLLLVGDGSDRLALESDSVAATGRVESVGGQLEQAAVVCVPLRTGGGMRVKVFEALALGKPVVASPLSVAGLEVRDGEQVVLADTDEQFARAIVALLRDRERRVTLGTAARSWAIEQAGKNDAAKQLVALYTQLSAPEGEPSDSI